MLSIRLTPAGFDLFLEIQLLLTCNGKKLNLALEHLSSAQDPVYANDNNKL